MPVSSLARKDGKRPGILLRFRPPNPDEGVIRVYPGKLKYVFAQPFLLSSFTFFNNSYVDLTISFFIHSPILSVSVVNSVTDTYQIIPVTSDTTVDEVMTKSLKQFGLNPKDINRYRLVEVSLEKGGKKQECFISIHFHPISSSSSSRSLLFSLPPLLFVRTLHHPFFSRSTHTHTVYFVFESEITCHLM